MTVGKMIAAKTVHSVFERCHPRALSSRSGARSIIGSACEALGAPARLMNEYDFGRHGRSLVAILDDSHCALHIWPDESRAVFEIFTSGGADVTGIISSAASSLGAVRTEVRSNTREFTPEAVSPYPHFPEYVLARTPLGTFAPAEYRRGVGRAYILEPEAISWQSFFASDSYTPPPGKDLLLLHPCSWAKPYDFSHYISQLRGITDQFPRIHRAIISNVGVVPFEYQLNEFFCSYDYVDLAQDRSDEQRRAMTEEFRTVTGERIEAYLRAHSDDYSAVVLLGHPVGGGYWETVSRVARELEKPGFQAPSAATYREATRAAAHDRDIDAPLFAPDSLGELERRMKSLLKAVDAATGGADG